jgi:hypothetical protein
VHGVLAVVAAARTVTERLLVGDQVSTAFQLLTRIAQGDDVVENEFSTEAFQLPELKTTAQAPAIPGDQGTFLGCS